MVDVKSDEVRQGMEWGFLAGENGKIKSFVTVRNDGGTIHSVEQELVFF